VQHFLVLRLRCAGSTQHFARRTEPLEPAFVLRTKLRFEFFAQTLRESRTLTVGGNGDLQISALHDGAVIEMAVFDVIYGVAENSEGIGYAIDGLIHAGNRRCSNNKKGILQIASLEFLFAPIDLAFTNKGGQGGVNHRRNNANLSSRVKQPFHLAS